MEFALITGGSKGIGKEMAILLAQKAYGLLLVARSEAELQIVKKLCEKAGSPAVYILAADLSVVHTPEKIFEWVKSLQVNVSVLINNAGYGLWGMFEKLDLKAQLDMMQVNMQALVALTHLFIPELKKNKKSYILNIASTAAYQSVPSLGVYSATKAFVLSFTRALRYELKNSGIRVTVFSPGATDTNFTNRAGMQAIQHLADKFNMSTQVVAKAGIAAMFSEKAETIPGAINAISVFSTRLLPKFLIEQIAANLYFKNLKN